MKHLSSRHCAFLLALRGSLLFAVASHCLADANVVAAPADAAHPPVGVQPRRPAGYQPYHYPESPADLLREATPALLKRAHAAWRDLTNEVAAGPYQPTPESFQHHPIPEWFLDAKFGMFVDWGPWSVAGWAPQKSKATYPDWYEKNLADTSREYHLKTWGPDIGPDDLIQLLRADDLHPAELVRLAKASGMRYVVPFLKHHGGYALWNSTFTRRNSVAWGLKRDLAREFAEACRHDGLRFGAYVSLGEWNYPVVREGQIKCLGFDGQVGKVAPTNPPPFLSGKIPVEDYACDYLAPSLKELIDQTSPDLLWYDGEWLAPATTWKSLEIAAYFYNRAAARGQAVCVNDRFAEKTRGQPGWGDFYTSEFHVLNGLQKHPWEENRSLSHSYGYNWEESSDDRYVLSEDESLDLLLRTVADGGNLLLMISPDGSGHVPPNQVKRLRFLGDWLSRNGEAVYATRPVGITNQPAWGFVTRGKDNSKLYLIVRHWPADGKLKVPVDVKPGEADLLAAPKTKLATYQEENGFTVELGQTAAPDAHASVIVVLMPQAK